ncbi:hypothetical protein FVE85_3003 [Porphyridium purpureum]|uniref:Uncharacterized protein n=1 Tax=Porphyridium purpureum TaxID=35688 RepID=A0A5J4YV86_PORPP|nr:hypothetical protein FVE85_3003 [Porphyridium purpureum]|eukprot:POR1575..scf227_4
MSHSSVTSKLAPTAFFSIKMTKRYHKQNPYNATSAQTRSVMSPAFGYAMETMNRDPLSPPPTDSTRDLSGWRRAVAQWNELHNLAMNSTNAQRRKTALPQEE